MIKKSLLFLLVVSLVLISDCAQQEVEIPPSVPEEIVEEATAIPEESPPMGGEANNQTDITPQQQDVTVTQPAIPETKVQKPTCSREFSPQFNAGPYYEGALFDAHFHVPDFSEVSVNDLLCTSDKEKVRGTILFYWNGQLSLEKRLAEAESLKNASSGKIRVFLAPVQYNLKELEDIEATHKGLFTGYGEMAFYNRGDPSQSYYPRSEERRVGKECRSRWSPYH